MIEYNKINLLGVYITPISYKNLLESLFTNSTKGYATLNSVHGIIESQKNHIIKQCINKSTFGLCDGRPLYWYLKNKKLNNIDHITGRNLMLKICEQAEKENKSVGLYGGSIESQNKCIERLKTLYPNLNIDFKYSPKFIEFNQKEKQDVIEKINISKIRFLFVCLGCPKQEVWMKNHEDELDCFMIGVGAAVDYIAGTIKPPPEIITRIGLEWLYRLIIEPKRLYKRYFYIVPLFIYLIIRNKLFKSK